MSPDPFPDSPVMTWQWQKCQDCQHCKNPGNVEEVKVDGKVVGYRICFPGGGGGGGREGHDSGAGVQPLPVPQCGDPGDGWYMGVGLVLLGAVFGIVLASAIWRG